MGNPFVLRPEIDQHRISPFEYVVVIKLTSLYLVEVQEALQRL